MLCGVSCFFGFFFWFAEEHLTSGIVCCEELLVVEMWRLVVHEWQSAAYRRC